MNAPRHTPDEDFAGNPPNPHFDQRDRWDGKADRPLPRFRILATLAAFTGIGMLALVD